MNRLIFTLFIIVNTGVNPALFAMDPPKKKVKSGDLLPFVVEELPAEVPEAMRQIHLKLAEYVRTHAIRTPREKLAFLLTMDAIIRLAQAHSDSEALRSAFFAARAAGGQAPWFRAFMATRAATDVASGHIWANPEEPVTTPILRNLEALFEATYTTALVTLPNVATPFETEATWQEFRARHFDGLRYEARVYLAPWIDVLDALMYGPAIVEFQMGQLDPDSPVAGLPPEIVRLVSWHVAPPLFFRTL